ncbi:Tex family protein [Scatolibacter rhodanostii]|uniref:Tex family protein n=1 Tax=Scatolibacter rhodanostii TaxID=2014781 RepID=UPI000C07ECD8|nr:Tex family protein [Scatolibacter rhodanostii]
MDFTKFLAQEFNKNELHMTNIIALIDEGNTIPFIARYRKEMTGSCDDQVLREIYDRLNYLRNLEKRKEDVIESITNQGKMTDELLLSLQNVTTLAEVEDLYRPYKQKRRTRATIAREKGLEPLAELIFAQDIKTGTIEDLARPFVNEEKEVLDTDSAIAGALDIIAEQLSDDAELRRRLRAAKLANTQLTSKANTEEDSVYRLYYDFAEPIAKLPSHRILAINRGEKEGLLKVSIETNNEKAVGAMERFALKGNSLTTSLVADAIKDSWQRLIFPSLEREIRNEMTEKASEQAIKMFGLNLKPLLLQPPVNGKVVLGFDPAYRTGCKIAVVDPTGKVLDTTVVYPTPPHKKIEEAKQKLKALINKHNIEVFAIGNGTASKESEIFVAELLKEIPQSVSYAMVNEAGASVYSASKLAAEEFPEYDVSLRSAVSIARRLQDPLAELVKIDPKAIGVGQYQHDMPVARLDEQLTGVVEDCVNAVGIDVNTASASLLSYISGLSMAVSKNVCAYREENGAFTARTQFKKVPKLGPKAFEQCAGFLRIRDGKNILDNTSVHPESYEAAQKLLDLFSYSKKDVAAGDIASLPDNVQKYGLAKTAEECGVGVPTLQDIIAELLKPGRDVRDSLPKPILRDDVLNMEDLLPGMDFMGTVRNVIDFGAFIDIGVHQDGLVHISRIADRYIKHPSEVVKVGDVVKVWVLAVEPEKKRISLTMRESDVKTRSEDK